MEETRLVKIEEIKPLEVFVSGKYKDILSSIKDKATIENPEVETKKGRDLIKSTAAKIASSKTLLEKIGKGLADEKRKLIDQELSAINSARKEIKENLDTLKAEVRKPLTDYENAIKVEQEAEKVRLEIQEKHAEALDENRLFNKEKELKAKEQKLEKEKMEREAEDRARIKLEKERENERLEASRKQAAAEAETERLKQKAIDDQKQAEINQKNAVEQEQIRLRAEEKKREFDRLEVERLEKEKAEKKAANREHQKKINNESLMCIINLGIPEKEAKYFLIAIIEKKIKNVSINY